MLLGRRHTPLLRPRQTCSARCTLASSPLQAADLEKAQLADSAAALGEKCAGLEQELKVARDSLASLRAVADQVGCEGWLSLIPLQQQQHTKCEHW